MRRQTEPRPQGRSFFKSACATGRGSSPGLRLFILDVTGQQQLSFPLVLTPHAKDTPALALTGAQDQRAEEAQSQAPTR